jgi:hypothetical protein
MSETVFYFDVAARAFLLGVVFGVGLASLFLVRTLTSLQLGSYVILFAYFHVSEFIFTAYFNPSDVKISCRTSMRPLDRRALIMNDYVVMLTISIPRLAFLIDHSMEYHLAILLAWLEYGLESLFLPPFKRHLSIILMGNMLLGEQHHQS